MKLGRQHAVAAILLAAFAYAAVYVVQRTEWVEKQVPVQTTDAERRDPEFRLKRVLTGLGARVQAPDTLAELPPPGATLVLGAWHWNLFPERSLALRRWVEAGGHLVVPHVDAKAGGIDWLAVRATSLRRPGAARGAGDAADDDNNDNDSDDDEDAPRSPVAGAAKPPPLPTCVDVREPASVAPAFGTARVYSACVHPFKVLQTRLPIAWALDVAHGHVVLRMPVGRGSVTLTAARMPWDNDDVLERDHALIAAAVVRAAPGREIWFVSNEARAPLLAWLWQRGAPAVLLGAAALGLALWRGAVRFGPRAAALPTARRSVAEQIRGTAGFIAHRGGGAALHAAQLRALDDAARQRIAGFDALDRNAAGTDARAKTIAAACGLDAAPLARAMHLPLAAAALRHPGPTLALLETARRRLLLNTPRPPRQV